MENSGKRVLPPKELRPSVRGMFDLHGNLVEWVHDWYEKHGTEGVTDPRGPHEGSNRVYRGGSWAHDAAFCRMAIRNAFAPSNRTFENGFRPALSPSGVWSAAEQPEKR